MEMSLVLILFVLIIVIDYIPIIRTKQKKIIIVYGSMMLISLIILILYTIDVNIPSPSNFIKDVVEKL